MSTGDIKNNVEKLRTQLRSIHYNGSFDVEGIINGKPEVFLPLLNYTLLQFSKSLAKFFIQKGYLFHNLSDSKFIETVYRLLINEFAYNPSLSIIYFLSSGFSERKVLFLCDVIHYCKKKHNELVKTKKKSLFERGKEKEKDHPKKTEESKSQQPEVQKYIPDIVREPKHVVLVRKEPEYQLDVDDSNVDTTVSSALNESDIFIRALNDLSHRMMDSIQKLDDKVDKNLSSLRDRVFLVERRVQALEESAKQKAQKEEALQLNPTSRISRSPERTPNTNHIPQQFFTPAVNHGSPPKPKRQISDTEDFINQLAQKHKIKL